MLMRMNGCSRSSDGHWMWQGQENKGSGWGEWDLEGYRDERKEDNLHFWPVSKDNRYYREIFIYPSYCQDNLY